MEVVFYFIFNPLLSLMKMKREKDHRKDPKDREPRGTAKASDENAMRRCQFLGKWCLWVPGLLHASLLSSSVFLFFSFSLFLIKSHLLESQFTKDSSDI